ncbi:MAG: hypothetical protein WCP96_17800 [Methylococcaceae bacterium]
MNLIHFCYLLHKERFTKKPGLLGFVVIFLMMSVSSQTIAASFQQVTVQVFAQDPAHPGGRLHYSWRVSEGSIRNIDAPITTWRIPQGPGVHFANVLVSNRLGGYTERRIAVISDGLGILAKVTPIKDFSPPLSNLNTIQISETEFVVAADTDYARSNIAGEGKYGNGTATFKRAVYLPDLDVNYTDEFSNEVFHALPNLSGRLSVWNSNHPICCLNGDFPYGHPHTHVNSTHDNPFTQLSPIANPSDALSYIVGSAQIQGGGICGTDNKFQGVQSTATAVLLDVKQKQLGGVVRVNSFGDYALPWNPLAWYVKVKCENNVPLTVAIDPSTSVADPAIFKASLPVVSNMTASISGKLLDLTTQAKAKFLPPDSGLPSSNFSRTDHFLAFKGVDTKQSACEYYRTIGAVQSCDATGNATGAVTFEDWKHKVGLGDYKNTGAFSGQKAIEYTATYINKMDLNLTRNHHAITYAINGKNITAAYVCNHLGPASEAQVDIDAAIDNAIHGRNLVACVAMDYGYELANGQPYVRYFTFAPNGQLLMSVNLDGRGEKHIPGTCIACHGGRKYDGQFPIDKRTSPDFGGHFLPYDVGNFSFSSVAGYTKAKQQKAIYHLNKIAQTTNFTTIASDLVNGWYHNDTVTVTDQDYLPQDWKNAVTNVGTINGAAIKDLYKKVEEPYCRSCHVAMDSERATNNPEEFANWQGSGTPDDDAFKQVICGGNSTVQRNHTMPNSLVTFNRMWADADAITLIKQWSGDNNCLNHPDPKLK